MLLRKVKILLPIVRSNGMSTTAAVITHLSLCPMHWAVNRTLLHAPNAVVGESCSPEELVDRLSQFGGQEFSAITHPTRPLVTRWLHIFVARLKRAGLHSEQRRSAQGYCHQMLVPGRGVRTAPGG